LEAIVTEQNDYVESAQEKSGNSKVIIIIAIVLVVLCCCMAVLAGAGWWLWNNGDELFGLTSQTLLQML